MNMIQFCVYCDAQRNKKKTTANYVRTVAMKKKNETKSFCVHLLVYILCECNAKYRKKCNKQSSALKQQIIYRKRNEEKKERERVEIEKKNKVWKT